MEPSTPHTQQIRDPRGGVSLLRNPLRITVLAGPDRKLAREFTGDRVVIGTHDSCDLVLGDPTVSRQHLEITLVAHGWALHDLDSRNGTFIGDVRVGDVVVDRDTRVRIGGTELRLQPLRSTVEVPLPAADGFGPLLGRSPALRRVFEVLGRVAGSDATVLVTGESGTGKEVAARAIHEASPRRDRPFVVVDCGGLPANLIESELYGHQRGAFTGATAPRDGAFVTADGGTLFLDEVGELPLELQTRLLGVLERRQVQPLGTSRPRSVDVRVIAATNRDLRKEVNRGGFRTDLYFRLAVVSVHLPPLREHPEDIPQYVAAMLAEWAEGGSQVAIDPETVARLQAQPWPGNVRELRNTIERAVLLGDLSASPAPPPATPAGEPPPAPPSEPIAADPNIPFKVGKALLIEQFERSYITALMQRFDQNITRATRAAEIDRVYMLRLLDKYGLRPGRTRG
ncbi:sigma 54-interacting transcriptional regulator [Nannocystis sp. ILAH1]|uniref:sigma 54-interacting transcriptional regulator n=1 Tax=unclassified Nannocystis TaxID=2627009 RepID=UPI00226F7EF1|nr:MULTISPECIES: sigma 54-interacting transcriptional regulator [unclassified Nannocystis]MCY0988005.1 sigma 54-interacting transcriptional regulator [Nannocystis sp. ILAH1]MCY1065652.1 sigma 54-interacting transcriptional regulator [Nannocystis sp. RBIL2]